MSGAHGPQNGRDSLQKCAALSLALGMVRGALFDALGGDLSNAQKVLNLTSSAQIATALGCLEGELTLDWNEHLTEEEIDRIKGF